MNDENGGKRVAFFGGSFDPPHLGHLAVARAAREALKLDTVLFAPVGAQPLKPQGLSTPFADRLEMTRLSIADEHHFELSLADAPKSSGAPNYTLETLLELRSTLPAGSTLFCLIGADSFMGLRKWRRAAEIPFAAPLVVASRPGEPLNDLRAALPTGLTMEPAPAQDETSSETELRCLILVNAAGDRTPFYLLPGLHVDISASEIRSQVRASSGTQTAAQHLIPGAVAEYIRRNGLYR